MQRIAFIISVLFACLFTAHGRENADRPAIVADATSGRTLPGASVFDRNGKAIGVSDTRGRLPYVSPSEYPVTVRYLGYIERIIPAAATDTVFMVEDITDLQEVVVESRQKKILHILAYVREYSTMSTYTDTVSLFREKMVDFMLAPDDVKKFPSRTVPRVLRSKSYYRFTDSEGLDSVSDACRHHFSWSDWVGIVPPPAMPEAIRSGTGTSDTLRGRYSPTEIWTHHGDRLSIDVNVMADTASRKWVPNLSAFFRNGLDFETFRIRFNYDNVSSDSVSAADLTGYSFNIESNGRGHSMFRFNRVNEPFCVNTYGEVYILDKEFITLKEARKWERRKFDPELIEIYEPAGAPELGPDILALIDRVNRVDQDEIRLGLAPDQRLASRKVVRQHIGQRALQLLKTITGINRIRMKRNQERNWKSFKQQWRRDSGRK
ncbi:MAG: carboxypeptidase-like regulatory domain-containing protein [Muribaculaceae bacterium]|nr:carboxypeptidase-like regulatory domain-containing protein [Muribaculaceae bacterium]